MPIDINLLRTETGKIFQRYLTLIIGADPEIVKRSQLARFKDPALIDEIIEIDN